MNKQEYYNFLVEKSMELHPETPRFFIELACQLQVKEDFDVEINLEPLVI